MSVESQVVSNQRYALYPQVLISLTMRQVKSFYWKARRIKNLGWLLWNGLGGHVEQGESVLSAAKRELLEESGLIAERCGSSAVRAWVDYTQTLALSSLFSRQNNCRGY
jgi:8-oxo-dGTP pyrophosphatase MutT (NUDIX family)